MIDTTKMSVDEIRAKLIQSGLPLDDVKNIKGKSNLASKLKEIIGEALSDLEITTTNETVETEEKTIEYLSPEWQDYVLSQFNKNELDDGYPLVAGLRRVTQKLLGPIISSKPVGFVSGNTCIYEVNIRWDDTPGEIRTFGGIGYADPSNFEADDEYGKYCPPIAETRGEGRALRKALGLNITFAEEMVRKKNTNKVNVEETETIVSDKKDTDPISTVQISLIRNLASRNNVDLTKLTDKPIESLTNIEALSIIGKLNEVQTNRKELN